jgi:hypothetical protein
MGNKYGVRGDLAQGIRKTLARGAIHRYAMKEFTSRFPTRFYGWKKECSIRYTGWSCADY